MNESQQIRLAGWAGIVGVVLLLVGGFFWGLSTFQPNWTDAALLQQATGSNEQYYAYLAYTLFAPALALLLWFATGLRRVLVVRAGSDRLAAVVVPGMAMFAGLMIAAVFIDLSSTFAAAWTEQFTPSADTIRALDLGAFGMSVGGLIGVGALVAATSRVLQTTRSASPWVVWIGYAVAFVCVFGLWTWGFAVIPAMAWLLGGSIGLIRAVSAMPVSIPAGTPLVPGPSAPAPTESAERTEPTT